MSRLKQFIRVGTLDPDIQHVFAVDPGNGLVSTMKTQTFSGLSQSRSDHVRPGHYAKKQVLCPNRIIGWSHRRRFQIARKLVESYAGVRLLDYGCGDGTFIAEVMDLFPRALGVEIDLQQTLDCRERFADAPGISFLLIDDLTDPAHNSDFDLVTCMEVLEHCLEPDVEGVIGDLYRLVSPCGRVIISVPVEIGPTLICKQLVRGFAASRRLGDYQHAERYTAAELWTMVFAGWRTVIPRPVYSSGPAGKNYHGHKGFNWRSLHHRLKQRFDVTRTLFSPLRWSRGYLSSQTWLLCRPR